MSSSNYFIDGKAFTADPIAPGLYIVATPIGNLKDITLRALNIMAAADIIACEDTRVTAKLTKHFSITTKMITFHDHSDDKKVHKLLNFVHQGQSVCLVSDAGTPLISDPGFELIREAQKQKLPIIPAPGASALLAGLVSSGLARTPFAFYGFLPAKKTARQTMLKQAHKLTMPVCFYESPHRVAASLQDVAHIFGAKATAYLGRELTKKFETHLFGTVQHLIDEVSNMERVRGELVLVVEPDADAINTEPQQPQIDQKLIEALEKMKVKDAAALVADELGLNKRDMYSRALELKRDP